MTHAVEPKLRSGGALTREQFLLHEIRLVARLRLDGVEDGEILRRAVDDNLFQYPTTRQSRNVATVCLARLDNLAQPELVRLLAQGEGAHEDAAQCNLYAMARTYRLMRRFLVEEIGVRYRTFSLGFDRVDMNAFFTRLTVESETVAGWSDGTIAKIKAVLRSCLHQAGILASIDACELASVFLCPELRRGMLTNGDADLLPAFNCLDPCYAESEA